MDEADRIYAVFTYINPACFAQNSMHYYAVLGKHLNLVRNPRRNTMTRNIFAIISLAFALGLVASAQDVAPRPRKSAKAASAPTPAAAPAAPAVETTTPTPAAPAAAPAATGSLVIGGTFPATTEATRHLKVPLTITGGTGPYKWKVSEGDVYETDKTHYWYYNTSKEGEVELTITVTDSSKPALTGERTVQFTVTPRVATMKDLDEQLAITAKGGDLTRLSNYVTYTGQTNAAVTRRGMDQLHKDNSRLHRDVKYLFYAVVGLITTMVLGAALFFFLGKIEIVKGAILLAVALGLGTDQFQLHAATAPTPAACTIQYASIPNGGVLVVEQKPTVVIIGVRNCADVKSVTADEVNFTDFSFDAKQGKIVVKAAATADAETGPTQFAITMADGTEVESNTVSLLVLSTETAIVRKAANEQLAAANKKVAALEAKIAGFEGRLSTFASIEAVNDKIREISDALGLRPTKVETGEMITSVTFGLTSRITKLEQRPDLTARVTTAETNVRILRDVTGKIRNKTNALLEATGELAAGQRELAGAEKRGGFLGLSKKALNPEVAEAAERIRLALLATSKVE